MSRVDFNRYTSQFKTFKKLTFPPYETEASSTGFYLSLSVTMNCTNYT